MNRAAILCLALFSGLALVASDVRAEIFRCTSRAGAVTYQELPCAEGERLRVVDVPASYPSADPAERERLFRREAELDRRLEARRERETRESIARLSQPVVQPAPAAEPQVVLLVPAFGRMPRRAPGHFRFPRPMRGS